jgi:hypothetical protein
MQSVSSITIDTASHHNWRSNDYGYCTIIIIERRDGNEEVEDEQDGTKAKAISVSSSHQVIDGTTFHDFVFNTKSLGITLETSVE